MQLSIYPFVTRSSRALSACVLVTCTLVWSNPTRATVLLEINGIDDVGVGVNTIAASPFTMGGVSYDLESITAPLAVVGVGGPNFTSLSVHTDNGGVPSDDVVASGITTVSTSVLTDHTVAVSGTLSANQTYWYVVQVVDGGATYLTDRNTAAAVTTGATPGFSIFARTTSNPTWTLFNQDPPKSLAYQLEGTEAVIPEASQTVFAVALGAAAAAFWHRRRTSNAGA